MGSSAAAPNAGPASALLRMRIAGLSFLLACLSALLLATTAAAADYVPRDGDIIFHSSRSAQSEAVQRATRSPFSHMGIVYLREGAALVFEAVQPVRHTPLDRWIGRGARGEFVVKRLVEADRLLTEDALARMHAIGATFEGRPYDLVFEWGDEQLYCSELVWKVYQRALGIEIGALQTLDAFDLSHPAVARKLLERWGGPPPMDQQVISPVAIFDSPLLETVFDNRPDRAGS